VALEYVEGQKCSDDPIGSVDDFVDTQLGLLRR